MLKYQGPLTMLQFLGVGAHLVERPHRRASDAQ